MTGAMSQGSAMLGARGHTLVKADLNQNLVTVSGSFRYY